MLFFHGHELCPQVVRCRRGLIVRMASHESARRVPIILCSKFAASFKFATSRFSESGIVCHASRRRAQVLQLLLQGLEL